MIIGLTGTLGAGKSSVADILKKKGFAYYSCSDYLRKELKRKKIKENIPNLAKLGNEIRKEYGAGEIPRRLLAMIKEKKFIVDSLRHPGEIDVLMERDDFFLVAVDAPIKLRYERVQKRKRAGDRISFEEFRDNEKKQMEGKGADIQLGKCIRMSKRIIINDSNIDDLNKKVDKLINDIEKIAVKNSDKKRKDYISWNDYFMGVAKLSALRSKDPNTQVGACIVNEKNKIVGIGYNGFPIGCSDDKLPWARKAKNELDTKYPYVAHAELNAILNSTTNLHGCRIYVALFPCNECAKLIIQSGIKEVIYLSDKYAKTNSNKAAKKMFDMSGVKYTRYKPKNETIVLKFVED